MLKLTVTFSESSVIVPPLFVNASKSGTSFVLAILRTDLRSPSSDLRAAFLVFITL